MELALPLQQRVLKIMFECQTLQNQWLIRAGQTEVKPLSLSTMVTVKS